jgi:L-lactate dehydrogenase complex protein LldE
MTEQSPTDRVASPSTARRSEARQSTGRPRVALFVTCLVDLFRPAVGFASIKLLENAGCAVEVPSVQTCCGQPAYNSGDTPNAAAIARQVVDAFEGYDYIVAPSGSCAGMLSKHYPDLLAADPHYADRARRLAAKTYELTQFLVDVRKVGDISDGLVQAGLTQSVTYHDSCSSLREMGVKTQPRKLLAGITGLNVIDLPDGESCCGFGGTFCVKYPEISNRMVEEKIGNVEKTGADLLLAGDLGCLLNMAGKLKRQGSKVQARHVAEVLAGDLDAPAIGEEAGARKIDGSS